MAGVRGRPTPTWPAWRGTRARWDGPQPGAAGPRSSRPGWPGAPLASTWSTTSADACPPAGPARRLLTVHDIQPLDLPANFSTAKRRYLGWALPPQRPSRGCGGGALAVGGRPVVGPAVGGARADPGGAVHLPHTAPRIARPGLRRWTGSLSCSIRLPPTRTRTTPCSSRPHAAVRARHPDTLLVLNRGAGPGPTPRWSSRRPALPGVVHLGHVDEARLAWLLAAARAVAFPSHYEGFGLPVLEAMQCGTPVIAADATALPEVLGDGGDAGRPPRRGRLGSMRCARPGRARRASHVTWSSAWPGPPSSPPNGPRPGCSTPGGPRPAPPRGR